MSDSLRPHGLGFPVPLCLPEFAQTHAHWFRDAIQPSYPLLPTSPLPSVFPSTRVFSSESVARIRQPKYWPKYWPKFQLPVSIWGWLPLGLTHLIFLLSKGLSSLQHHNSKASTLWCSAFFMEEFYVLLLCKLFVFFPTDDKMFKE